MWSLPRVGGHIFPLFARARCGPWPETRLLRSALRALWRVAPGAGAQIRGALEGKSAGKANFVQLSSEFYSLIPTTSGRKAPERIDK